MLPRICRNDGSSGPCFARINVREIALAARDENFAFEL
jgi:hypothetical protein